MTGGFVYSLHTIRSSIIERVIQNIEIKNLVKYKETIVVDEPMDNDLLSDGYDDWTYKIPDQNNWGKRCNIKDNN